jgi:hypothetical protein
MCKVIHPKLKSSDPFHRALSLDNPITDVPLQRSVPVRVPSRGRGSGSEARLGLTVRGVITTTLMVTRVATSISSVPLGLLRVSLRCSRGLLCCLHASSHVSARWFCEAVAHLSHPIKLQCKTFIRVQVWPARHDLSVVDHKALTELSLLRVPHFRGRRGASLKDLNADTMSMSKSICFLASR